MVSFTWLQFAVQLAVGGDGGGTGGDIGSVIPLSFVFVSLSAVTPVKLALVAFLTLFKLASSRLAPVKSAPRISAMFRLAPHKLVVFGGGGGGELGGDDGGELGGDDGGELGGDDGGELGGDDGGELGGDDGG